MGFIAVLIRSTNPDQVHAKEGDGKVRPSDAGGREVVETVVFVVVLVLLLKMFAAEAFVIPTGSMAETLYGYHKMIKCPACGIDFPVNCSDEVDPQDRQAHVIDHCQCPNCRKPLELIAEKETERLRNRLESPGLGPTEREAIQKELTRRETALKSKDAVPDPGPSSGDRVLVAKFLYDTFLARGGNPNRLDVVVFKFPGKSDSMSPGDPLVEGPQKNHVAMNYIKRLVGLPGETIVICGGDLYVLPPDKSPTYNDRERAREVDLWQKEYTHQDDQDVLRRFREHPEEFTIIQKPPPVVLSTMRIVYDNDHPASDLTGPEYQRWRGEGEGWETLDDGKAFRHDSGDAGWLRYNHVLRGGGGKQTLITDFLGYNTDKGDSGNKGNWVGDLILETEAKIDRGEGELTLELVRAGEKFQAIFTLGDEGQCTLMRLGEGTAKKVLGAKKMKLGKGTRRLRFANVDRRLVVWVDNELPFGEGVDYERGENRAPNGADLQPASIGTKGAGVTLQKIKLYRDSYYNVDANVQDVNIQDWSDPHAWTGLKTPPARSLYVQLGHYLCLGDNSPASSDGRSWGLVPQRLLLGRALLVYYPFSRAGRIR
jgi:signal peptidase I